MRNTTCNLSYKKGEIKMKRLFMALLTALEQHAKLIEARMYKEQTFSSMTFEFEDGTYTISITKEKTDGND